MTTLATRQTLTLSNRANERSFASTPVTIDPLTSTIAVRLRRPTTAAPLAWSEGSAVSVTIIGDVDGVEYRCTGRVSGGVRTRRDGSEIDEYILLYKLPVIFGDKARSFIAESTPDEFGFYNNVPLTRVGESGQIVTARVVIERVTGSAQTELISAEALPEPAPTVRHKNSVAFDAASSAQETSGDGILSVSHTSTGSDRAVFIGVGGATSGAAVSSTSVTYGGTGATEMWDTAIGGGDAMGAGYRLAGQATGSQTVTSTISGSGISYQSIGVVSMTGVDQTTPVGSPATDTSDTNTASVTVGSVGADDMVVDNYFAVTDTAPTVGANQTERFSQTGTIWLPRGSTQSGADGGVMSWSTTSPGFLFWALGAVAFKPSAGATAAVTRRLLNIMGVGA